MIDVETEYEKRKRSWKKISLLLMLFLFISFFLLLLHVENLIEESAPYIAEECTFALEGKYMIKDEIGSEENALRAAEKYFNLSQKENMTAQFVFQPCAGWEITAENGVSNRKVVVCRSGDILVYRRICRKRSLERCIGTLLKFFTGEK